MWLPKIDFTFAIYIEKYVNLKKKRKYKKIHVITETLPVEYLRT